MTKQTQTIRNAESRIKKHDPSIRNHYEIANKPLTDNTRYCRKDSDDRTFVSMLVTLTNLLIINQTVKFEIRFFKMVILNQIFLNRNKCRSDIWLFENIFFQLS